jgi:hypothetical protein
VAATKVRLLLSDTQRDQKPVFFFPVYAPSKVKGESKNKAFSEAGRAGL